MKYSKALIFILGTLCFSSLVHASTLKPVSLDATTLSKKQLNAPKQMYAALSNSRTLKKSNFETTAEFEVRRSQQAAELDSLAYYAVELEGKIEFDADRGGYVSGHICSSLLAKSLSRRSLEAIRCDLPGVITSKKSEYTGSNAYGFMTQVDKDYREELAFKPGNINEMLLNKRLFSVELVFNRYYSVDLRVPFDREKARARRLSR